MFPEDLGDMILTLVNDILAWVSALVAFMLTGVVDVVD